jgi:hypothetical protein
LAAQKKPRYRYRGFFSFAFLSRPVSYCQVDYWRGGLHESFSSRIESAFRAPCDSVVFVPVARFLLTFGAFWRQLIPADGVN